MITDLYDPTAIPTAWQKFWAQFPKVDLPGNNQAWGVSTPIEGSQGQLHYVAGVEIKAGYVAPAGFEVVVIPAGNYLDVTHVGPITTLAQSYGEAYGVVFPSAANNEGSIRADAYVALGRIAFDQGKFKESVALCETAKEIFEKENESEYQREIFEVNIGLSRNYEKLERRQDAAQALGKAIDAAKVIEMFLIMITGDILLEVRITVLESRM